MFAGQEQSYGTFIRYNDQAVSFIRFYRERCRRDDLWDMPYEDCILAAAHWFLDQHERWSSEAYIRNLALSLTQWVEMLKAQEMVPDDLSQRLLDALREKRPRAAKKRTKRGYAKSIKPQDLRRLIDFFRLKENDDFSLWIAGLLQLSARIGWRPGEMTHISRDGNYLHAPAEKNTNERGLDPICEVDVGAYPPRMLAHLDAWISDREQWVQTYRNEANLRSTVLGRIRRACKKLKIRPINLYTLRHVAISSMKKSGYSRSEIAVLINHATSRTAGEKYGKARCGVKRAKKLLGYQSHRLERVRDNARSFSLKHLRASRLN